MIYKPIFDAFITASILDTTGRVLSSKTFPMHSFVKQWTQLLHQCAKQVNETNVRDILNTLRTANAALPFPRLNALATIDTGGIVVGTASSAVDASDYKLGTQTAHGNAATQLYHQAVTFDDYALVGQVHTFVIHRQFDNNSGGTITLNECGLYAINNYNYCIARDLISGGLAVNNLKTAKISYTFQTTTS